LMDESLRTILGGDVSPATREALLKQLDQETIVSLPAPRNQMEPRQAAGMGAAEMEGPLPGGPAQGGSQGRLQQRPRVEASINDPVTKVVGLILGTPEFQRQ
jgi:hypothetical protein